jgi:flagellar hook assembly protein FlgD
LTPTDARDDDTEANALVFRLHGNVPNPFATSTAIAFSLAQESEVRLHIYDLSGRLVRELVARQLGPGRHHVNWDGDDALGHRVAQGIYFMRLQAGAFETSKKLVLLR